MGLRGVYGSGWREWLRHVFLFYITEEISGVLIEDNSDEKMKPFLTQLETWGLSDCPARPDTLREICEARGVLDFSFVGRSVTERWGDVSHSRRCALVAPEAAGARRACGAGAAGCGKGSATTLSPVSVTVRAATAPAPFSKVKLYLPGARARGLRSGR